MHVGNVTSYHTGCQETCRCHTRDQSDQKPKRGDISGPTKRTLVLQKKFLKSIKAEIEKRDINEFTKEQLSHKLFEKISQIFLL